MVLSFELSIRCSVIQNSKLKTQNSSPNTSCRQYVELPAGFDPYRIPFDVFGDLILEVLGFPRDVDFDYRALVLLAYAYCLDTIDLQELHFVPCLDVLNGSRRHESCSS